MSRPHLEVRLTVRIPVDSLPGGVDLSALLDVDGISGGEVGLLELAATLVAAGGRLERYQLAMVIL